VLIKPIPSSFIEEKTSLSLRATSPPRRLRTRVGLSLALLLVVAATCASAFLVASCGGHVASPLDGTWLWKIEQFGTVATLDITLGDDGTISTSFRESDCTGQSVTTGPWSHTATTLTVGEYTGCSGDLVCPTFGDRCQSDVKLAGISGQTWNYSLSADRRTLKLTPLGYDPGDGASCGTILPVLEKE